MRRKFFSAKFLRITILKFIEVCIIFLQVTREIFLREKVSHFIKLCPWFCQFCEKSKKMVSCCVVEGFCWSIFYFLKTLFLNELETKPFFLSKIFSRDCFTTWETWACNRERIKNDQVWRRRKFERIKGLKVVKGGCCNKIHKYSIGLS